MRPSSGAVALLACVVLVLPLASACSFAGEGPPPPGSFVIVDLEDGTEWRIEVEHRQLGGTCELSNPAALAGGHLAWIDGPRDARRLRLQDIHAADPLIDLPIVADPFEISLFDRTVLIPERGRLRVADLESGAEREVPMPTEGFRAVDKHLVAHQDGFGEGATLSVYDARADAWRLRDRPMEELGARWWPFHVSDGWVVLHSEPEGAPPRHHLLDLVSGELRDLALPASTSADGLDGDLLYFPLSRDENGSTLDPPILARMRLPDGPIERVARPAPYATIADGLALFRLYSPADHRPIELLDDDGDDDVDGAAASAPRGASPAGPSAPPPAGIERGSTPTPGEALIIPGAAPPLTALLAGLAAALLALRGSVAAERRRKSLRRRR